MRHCMTKLTKPEWKTVWCEAVYRKEKSPTTYQKKNKNSHKETEQAQIPASRGQSEAFHYLFFVTGFKHGWCNRM